MSLTSIRTILNKVILEQLRAKPEIDYEKCSALLFELITQLCAHYQVCMTQTEYRTSS